MLSGSHASTLPLPETFINAAQGIIESGKRESLYWLTMGSIKDNFFLTLKKQVTFMDKGRYEKIHSLRAYNLSTKKEADTAISTKCFKTTVTIALGFLFT